VKERQFAPKPIMRVGQPLENAPKKPPSADYLDWREDGLRIERNVGARLRDGVRILIDIYRPDGLGGENLIGTLYRFQMPRRKRRRRAQVSQAFPGCDRRGHFLGELANDRLD
jgi:predicted acyl esterase